MNRIDILTIPIDLVSYRNVLNHISDLLAKRKQIHIGTPNPEQLVLASKNPQFAQILRQTKLNIPDGMGLVWAIKRKLRIQNSIIEPKSIERVTGVDLMQLLCKHFAGKYKVGLLGGMQDSAQKTATHLLAKYPELNITALADYICGEKTDRILQQINEEKINILFVALGAPKQETFIAQNLAKLPTVRIAMGVGGAFDVLGGKLKRPPVGIQQMGLEWLFRLVQEPRRIKRQLSLVEFAWRVMRDRESE